MDNSNPPRFLRGALWIGLLFFWGASASADAQATGIPLDLSGYKMTFDETFSTLSISAHGPDTRWTTHTPWNGDFGDATFVNPGSGNVFTTNKNGLAITASKGPDGHWRSGLICSVSHDGDPNAGFTQKYGYFEMMAKLPSGMGTWPAFWLVGINKSHAAAEIDVIEYYGGFPSYFHTTEHVWVNGRIQLLRGLMSRVPSGSLSTSFNRFGVLITKDTTSFYLNRHEFWSTPTPPEYRQPMYILADLALGGGWPIAGLASPQVMQIKYIRAYQAPGP